MNNIKYHYRELSDKEIVEKLQAAVKLAEEKGFKIGAQIPTEKLFMVKDNQAVLLTNKIIIDK